MIDATRLGPQSSLEADEEKRAEKQAIESELKGERGA